MSNIIQFPIKSSDEEECYFLSCPFCEAPTIPLLAKTELAEVHYIVGLVCSECEFFDDEYCGVLEELGDDDE